MSSRTKKNYYKRTFKHVNRKHTNKNYLKDFPQKREYRHQDQLSEAEVGITEFVSNYEGFSGVIKARYSDFHVNEINLEGKVAKLTDNKIPRDSAHKAEKVNYKEVEISPIEQIPQETWDAIKLMLLKEGSEHVNLSAEHIISNKESRAKVHECVKKYFGQKIVASTLNVDGKKFMQFKKYNNDGHQDRRIQWPEDKGEWVHFLVYKEALDTLEACLKISDCLNMSPSNFSYAGVKDKRAKSTQWFCVRKVEPWKLITKTRSIKNLKIGNFEFRNKCLKIGQLVGNKFRIAVRNVSADDDLIKKAVYHIQEHGFINYYGLQRFGNDREVPTYLIGIKLLQGKWKEAAELILKPKTSDDPSRDVARAKKTYLETGNALKALEEMVTNKNNSIEAKLLEGLSKSNENDYFNALENIPRNMRLLYLHSFQSLLWNKMVSKRIQLFGLQPVEGDFVLINEENSADVMLEEEPLNFDNGSNDEKDEFKCKMEVKAITSEELARYTIYDIVLPLPGCDVMYPESLKLYYKEAVEEYGLSLDMPKQKAKCYNLSGNYRKIMGHVKEFSWKIMYFNNPTYNLIRSDFEEMLGHAEPHSVENGKYKALILEFSLSSSSYATMVLRELLKSDTSTSAQARLNDYHEADQAKIIGVSGEKKKIILNENNENVDDIGAEEIVQTFSLLGDNAKYEEFKNAIFNSQLENSVKRKNEQDEVNESCSKRIKDTEDKKQLPQDIEN